MRQIWVVGAVLAWSGCTESQLRAEGPPEVDVAALFGNSGFEAGNTSSWTVTTALVATTPGVQTYPVVNESQLGLRTGGVAKTNVYDAGTPYLLVPPGLTASESARFPRFGRFAAVVNELGSSHNANRITQASTVTTADIDPADGLVHVRFTVLPVLQNPGHPLREQPYYFVTISNQTKGTVLASRFNFSNEAGVPWQTNAAGNTVYTDWLLFDLPLSRSAVSIGDTLVATVIAGGCAQSGHWGEAIIDSFGSSIPGLVVYGSGPDSVEAGADFQYTYRVLNGSAELATGVRLTSYLPAGVTFRSVDTPGIACATPTVGTRGTLVCDLGAVAVGGAVSVRVTVRADATATGAIRHGWYYSQSNQEQPLTGPLITTNVTTGGTTAYVDLITSVDDAATSVMWGQHVVWSVTVRNAGPATATNAPISATTSAQLTNLTWACAGQFGGVCGASAGTGALASTATLPSGASVTYSLEADLIAGSGPGLVSVTALANAPAGTVEISQLDNGSGDDDTISGSMVPVAVVRAGVGAGAIVSSPSGLSCGSGCTSTSGSFAVGTQVTLQPVPASGSTFAGWSGGTCSGVGACTFTVASGQTITGTFDRNPLAITSPSTTKAAVGRPFSFTVTAIGTAPLAFSATNLPSWLAFDAQTAVLSGTATAAGTFTIDLSVSDVNGTATQVLTITAGQPPLITSALTYTLAGASTAWTTIDVNASGATPLQFNASNLPGTVYFNSTNGTFAGTSGATGVFNVPVVATNAFGSDYKVIAVSVGGAPVITSPLTASASVGTPWTYTLTATGTAPLVLGASSLPAWATFTAATGVITGTPTSAGTISIGLSATNGVGASNQTLLLTIDGPAVITSATAASGMEGDPFSYSLTAEGTAPLTRTMTGLPAWLGFDPASGLSSGTPPAAGVFTVTMGASNSIGSDAKTLTITIAARPPAPTPPLITSGLVAQGTVGSAFTYSITASGQVPMTFGATGLPGWATLDPNSGLISGTPSAGGSFSIQLSATNALGSDSKTLSLTILSPPQITSALTATGQIGTPFSYLVAASGSAPVTLGASGLPSWASFDSNSGSISGTPTADGVTSVSLSASNAAGSDTKALVITIESAPAITSALAVSGIVGQPFTYTITASGSAPIGFGALGLPSWATQVGAVISGTPTSEGVSSVSLTATNSAGSDGKTLVITVRQVPQITSSLAIDAVVGVPFSYSLIAIGTAPLSLSASGLPGWAQFDANTGVISGIPTVDGITTVSLGASNSVGSDSKALVITARTAPLVTSGLVASAIVGQPFSYTLTASGTAPIGFGATGLPSWATRTGQVISGTPTAEGTSSIVLSATNPAGSDARTLVLTVRQAPAITGPSTADAIVGVPFSQVFTVTGTAPVTLQASPLPSWASFDASSGVLSGTPVAEEVVSISVSATNLAGSASVPFTITVRTVPSITSANSASAVVGRPFSHRLTAVGSAPLTFGASGLPAWASFDAQTATISGTPTEEGTVTIALSVSNAAGRDDEGLTIVVSSLPIITSSLSESAIVGVPFSYQLTAAGTAPITIGASSLPSWASFDANTGVLSGVPDADGTFSIDLVATNLAGTDSKVLTLTVRTRPQITSALLVEAVVGAPFSWLLTTVGTEPLAVSFDALPAWSSFDSNSRTLSGVPPTVGDTRIEITISNPAGVEVKTLLITARERPIITNALEVHGLVGRPLSFVLSATGTAPLSYLTGALPPGLTRNGPNISGTPSTAGRFLVLERVSNAAGVAEQLIVFVVRDEIPAPIIILPVEGAVLASGAVTVSGAAPVGEAGNVVRVRSGGQVLCDGLILQDGTWSCVLTFAEGAHRLEATIVDVHGIEGLLSDTQPFSVDLTAPQAPQWTAPAAGALLATRFPTLAGTGEPGAHLVVTSGSMRICATVVALDGTWSCVPAAALADGEIDFEAVQTDAAGHESPPVLRRVRVDATAPAAPSITAPGLDERLTTRTPTVSGTAEPASSVEVSIDGRTICTTVADSSGRWSCPAPSLLDGVHEVAVTSHDEAGNTSGPISSRFVVDLTAPVPPTIAGPAGLITTRTPTVTGLAEPGASVRVLLDGKELCVVVASGDGRWSCPVLEALALGTHTLEAIATDPAGNLSSVVRGTFDVQDATGAMAEPTASPDTDNPSLSGTATPGATVNVYVDGQLVGTTTADESGKWSFDLPRLEAGDHQVAIGVVGTSGDEVFRSPSKTLAVEKVTADFGGGLGCSTTSSGPIGAILLLAMLVLGRRRRAGAAVAVVVASVTANAQTRVETFEVEQLALNPSARGGLVVGGADLLSPSDFRVAAAFGYQNAPLKYFENGGLRASLVEHRVTGWLSGSFGVTRWLELGANLPVILFQSGQAAQTRLGQTVVAAVPTSGAIGMPWAQLRGAVLQERDGAPLDLGVTLSLGLPLGSAETLSRDSTVASQLLVGAGRTFGPVRVAGEAGVHLRSATALTSATPEEVVGSRALVSAAVSTVRGPLRGELSVRGFAPFAAQPASVEVMGGGRYALGDWELFAFAGPGFGNAPGTPAFRAVAGVSFGGRRSAKCGGRSHVAAECPELDFDGDGVSNDTDWCPEQPVPGSPDGCPVAPKVAPVSVPAAAPVAPPDADGDGVIDALDACPEIVGRDAGCPPRPAEVVAAPNVALAQGKLELKVAVYFETSRAELQARSFSILDEVAAVMAAHPEVTRVSIEGHTDDRGGQAFNLPLSDARAKAVKRYLEKAGVAPERLEAKGYGQARPIAPNVTAEGRERNRRVEFIVLE